MRNVQFGKPMLGPAEKQAVADVLEGDILVHGPRAKNFENDFAAYTGAPYAVSTSNCTAALHLCYFYKKIGLGDEVIVPAMTHNATAHAVELTGAKAVFVDADFATGNIAIDQIEAAITERTKAISVVHYLGMPVAMDKIMAIAEKYGLFVVEDCALSLGAYYKGKHTGLWGDAGCYSFYPVKHITTAEGGMIISKHEDLAAKITRQRAFGVDRTASERSIPGVYDVTMLGFNYRMSEVHAALGIEQVKRMNEFLRIRKENYDALTAGLREIDELHLFESTGGDFQSSYYCHSAVLNAELAPKRFEIVSYLKEQGVGTSVYYPRAVPHFTYYKEKYGYTADTFPVAAKIASHSIALPVAQHLNLDDMAYIVEKMKEAIASVQ